MLEQLEPCGREIVAGTMSDRWLPGRSSLAQPSGAQPLPRDPFMYAWKNSVIFTCSRWVGALDSCDEGHTALQYQVRRQWERFVRGATPLVLNICRPPWPGGFHSMHVTNTCLAAMPCHWPGCSNRDVRSQVGPRSQSLAHCLLGAALVPIDT